MEVYTRWVGLKEHYANLVLGLGNFDGVHLGHQRIIGELVRTARETGGTPAVFTFYPHPMTVLDPDHAPPLLLSQEAKRNKMAELGVEVLLWVPFDREIADMEPECFVEQVLYREMNVAAVFVGYNYTFGRGGRGTAAMLEEYGRRMGFRVHVIPPVTVEGKVVSSTLIRQLIQEGDVSEAAKFLGYYPFIEGVVVSGEKRGRQLGFPTANINPDANLVIPADGVYSVKVHVNRDTFLGVANVGIKPTFHGLQGRRNVEVHLLDFCGNLYGQTIRVIFTRRLRGEKRFTSVAELVKQIEEDIYLARFSL